VRPEEKTGGAEAPPEVNAAVGAARNRGGNTKPDASGLTRIMTAEG
jgi:hypothetical protein